MHKAQLGIWQRCHCTFSTIFSCDVISLFIVINDPPFFSVETSENDIAFCSAYPFQFRWFKRGNKNPEHRHHHSRVGSRSNFFLLTFNFVFVVSQVEISSVVQMHFDCFVDNCISIVMFTLKRQTQFVFRHFNHAVQLMQSVLPQASFFFSLSLFHFIHLRERAEPIGQFFKL